MRRRKFTALLIEATERALAYRDALNEKAAVDESERQRFAQFGWPVLNRPLSRNVCYLVTLNASFSGEPPGSFHDYPEDSRSRHRYHADADGVVDLLWREGRVPRWTDMFVEVAAPKWTLLRVTCAGDYQPSPITVGSMWAPRPSPTVELLTEAFYATVRRR